ncbi:hypothetical protein LEP1GSC127_2517 [Leptospira kirschneri str. 200801925]|nr:hypothetical protein LEP1GSC127_2517 [Leptospira kirschneri str. 200801925]
MKLLEFSKTFFLNIQTVFWKEFSIYFNSPVGSIFASFFLFLTSFLFFLDWVKVLFGTLNRQVWKRIFFGFRFYT